MGIHMSEQEEAEDRFRKRHAIRRSFMMVALWLFVVLFGGLIICEALIGRHPVFALIMIFAVTIAQARVLQHAVFRNSIRPGS